LWEKCQAVRRNFRSGPPQAKHTSRTYPLAGLIFCEKCKRPHRGGFINGRRYYRDTDYDYGGACDNKRYINSEEVERQLAEILMSISLSDKLKGRVLAMAAAPVDMDSKDVESLRARAKSKQKRAQELYVEGVTTRAEYDNAIRESQLVLDKLNPVQNADTSWMAKLLEQIPVVWQTANGEERKTLLRAMLERVYVRDGRVVTIQPTSDMYRIMSIAFGGPDGIRTRDLGLDRAACLATTPRVQFLRDRNIP
jgi:hypothetical protein